MTLTLTVGSIFYMRLTTAPMKSFSPSFFSKYVSFRFVSEIHILLYSIVRINMFDKWPVIALSDNKQWWLRKLGRSSSRFILAHAESQFNCFNGVSAQGRWEILEKVGFGWDL